MGLWRVGEKSEAVVVVLGHVVVGKMKWRDVQVEWEGKLGTGEKEGWMVVQEWYCCGEKNQPVVDSGCVGSGLPLCNFGARRWIDLIVTIIGIIMTQPGVSRARAAAKITS